MYKLLINTNVALPFTPKENDKFTDGEVFDTMEDAIGALIRTFSTVSKLHIDIMGPTKWSVKLVPFIMTYEFIIEEVSLRELADAAKETLGLETYDTALPQMWVDDVRTKTGEFPFGFVWGYGKGIFGEPIPLTTAAKLLLNRYENSGG